MADQAMAEVQEQLEDAAALVAAKKQALEQYTTRVWVAKKELADIMRREADDNSVERAMDLEEDEDPFTFTVKVPLSEKETDRRLIERIVDANKPAHTNYKLLFKKASRKKRDA